MALKKPAAPFDIAEALTAAYSTNNRISEYLVGSLAGEAWRAKPPGGKGRDVASIVAHMHNVRLMWLKSAAPEIASPPKLEGDGFSPEEAIAALRASHDAVRELLATSLQNGGRIKGFKPDAASFAAYLIAHDAHHRGQAAMLTRQLGHPLPAKVMYGMWEWGSR